MANWVVFNNSQPKPVNVAVNLDAVKIIQPGTAPNTVSLDGLLVVGTVAQIMMMVGHETYPGVTGAPITAA